MNNISYALPLINDTDFIYDINFIKNKKVEYETRVELQNSIPVDLISYGQHPEFYYLSSQAIILLDLSESWFDAMSAFYKKHFRSFYDENTEKLGKCILYSCKFVFVMMMNIPMTKFNQETADKIKENESKPFDQENLSIKQRLAVLSFKNGRALRALHEKCDSFHELYDCLRYSMLCDNNRWARFLYGLDWGYMIAVNPKFTWNEKEKQESKIFDSFENQLIEAAGPNCSVRIFVHLELSPQGHEHAHLLVSVTKKFGGKVTTTQNRNVDVEGIANRVFKNCDVFCEVYDKNFLGAFYTVKGADLSKNDYLSGSDLEAEVELAKENYKIALKNRKQRFINRYTENLSPLDEVYLPFSPTLSIAA